MACLKLGSKSNAFERKGTAVFYTTALRSDVLVKLEEISFHLHKFPLVSRSGRLLELIKGVSDVVNETCCIQLNDIPGGAEAFELVAKFCYGVRLELTASNVVMLRCAAEWLEMTEEFGEENLIARTEGFLNQVVFKCWEESIRALQSCESVLSHAEQLGIVEKCVDSIATKACMEPDVLGWCIMRRGSILSPGGSILWNGISTGAKAESSQSDWWYEDLSVLRLPLYKMLIATLEDRGIELENIAGAVMHFAKRNLPALNRYQGTQDGSNLLRSISLASIPSEGDQKDMLETIEGLLPMQKGVASTDFLCVLLQIAIILNASPACKSSLEKRIGMQLEQASLENLLFRNLNCNLEPLYDISCVQRILDHFLLLDQSNVAASTAHQGDDGQFIDCLSIAPMMTVARLIDSYLAEVAPDVNLKLSKFILLADSLPHIARTMDDGLYQAVDIYLKAHPWLTEQDREDLCRTMDCQKLSLEACTHAAQNERLPLRIVLQVLFFEQIQLRAAIANCFMVTGNLENGHSVKNQSTYDGPLPAAVLRAEGRSNAFCENQVLKVSIDSMMLRVRELEKECSCLKQEIGRLGNGKGSCHMASSIKDFWR